MSAHVCKQCGALAVGWHGCSVETTNRTVDATVDCRTCSHCAPRSDLYCYADTCTNADRYDPLPVVQLWRKT